MLTPVVVPVGGRKVRVEYHESLQGADGAQLAGELVCGAGVVRVSTTQHSSAQDVFRTLYHELTHYALELTGHSAQWTDAQEEPLVYALENMLADLFVFASTAGIKYREVQFSFENESD